jgi:hypothetical protein
MSGERQELPWFALNAHRPNQLRDPIRRRQGEDLLATKASQGNKAFAVKLLQIGEEIVVAVGRQPVKGALRYIDGSKPYAFFDGLDVAIVFGVCLL